MRQSYVFPTRGRPSLYNPKDIPPNAMKEIFTDRDEILKKLRKVLKSFTKKGERRHTLLIGDRGVGKSTILIKLCQDLLEKKKKVIIPLLFTDWNLHDLKDLGDVLLRFTQEIAGNKWLNNKGAQKLTLEEKINQAEKILRESSLNSKFVLFVENLQEFFDNNRKTKKYMEGMRAFFENNPNLLFIGSSVGLPKAFLNYHHPFFGFFDIVNVEPFDEEEMILQIENMAKHYNIANLLDQKGRLKKDVKIKVKSIHHITSGYPRLGVCLFDILTFENPAIVMCIFNNVMDVLTPYFEGMEQKLSMNEKYAFGLIVKSIAPDVTRKTFSIKELSKIEEIDNDLMRSLLSKLKTKGFITVTEKKGRILIYRIANPLFALWFIKSHIKDASESGRHILEFIHAFYTLDEILEKFGSLETPGEAEMPVIAAVEKLRGEYVYVVADAGVKLAKEGKIKEALKKFDKAIEAAKRKQDKKTLAKILINKGTALRELARYEEALEMYEKSIKIAPKNPYTWYLKGKAFNKLGKSKEALKAYEKSIELKPKHADQWYGIGHAFRELGKHEKALEAYEKSIELKPKHGCYWHGKGNALLNLGEHEIGLKAYEKSIELNPKHADHWYGKGNALSKLGKFQEALKAYEKSVELNPKHSDHWYGKGYALRKLKKPQEALQAYEKSIKLNPKNAYYWLGKGYSLRDLGKLEEALQAIEKSIELDPKQGCYWDSKGDILVDLGKFENALNAYEKSIGLNPTHASHWFGKGFALSELGKYKEALEAFKKSIELDPREGCSWSNKGNILIELGRDQEALDAYNKAIELNPEHATHWFGKGIALGKLKKYDEAIVANNRAIEISRDKKDIFIESMAEVNRVNYIIHGDFPFNIKDDILPLLNLIRNEEISTQTRVEFILSILRTLIQKEKLQQTFEALQAIETFDQNLPPEEKISPSFEPVALAVKYLKEGEKTLNGITPTLQKEVKMLLGKKYKKHSKKR